jgi:hypothetical protein
MVNETSRLRALIFDRTGIAVDEKDPIMAVLVACAQQSEEIGARLLARTSPVRVVAATAITAIVFASAGAWAAWDIAQRQFSVAHSEWLRHQHNARIAKLLTSEEGRAAIRLSELGVARILANCNGRRSWQVHEGYCVLATPDGRPDGFRVSNSR